MTNKLLIPVDFTKYSTQAIDYACLLCNIIPHDIVFIHIFTDHSNSFHNNSEDEELKDPQVEFAKREMDLLFNKYQGEYPDIRFTAIMQEGNLFDQLEKTVSKDTYEAIIMGTKGSSGLDAFLIGSNMFEVFQNTGIPVLAVPLSEKPYKTTKIGLLCNFKDGEIEVLKQASKLYGSDFELILIHVNTTNDNINTIDKKFEVFIDKIILETGIDDISYVVKAQTFFIKYKEDISSAIDSVITDELLDALLVTKSKKSFLRKVIEENVVKKMAYQIQIPKFFCKS